MHAAEQEMVMFKYPVLSLEECHEEDAGIPPYTCPGSSRSMMYVMSLVTGDMGEAVGGGRAGTLSMPGEVPALRKK